MKVLKPNRANGCNSATAWRPGKVKNIFTLPALHQGGFPATLTLYTLKQDAQLSQRDRAAGCVIVFAKSRRLELGDNILRTV